VVSFVKLYFKLADFSTGSGVYWGLLLITSLATSMLLLVVEPKLGMVKVFFSSRLVQVRPV